MFSNLLMLTCLIALGLSIYMWVEEIKVSTRVRLAYHTFDFLGFCVWWRDFANVQLDAARLGISSFQGWVIQFLAIAYFVVMFLFVISFVINSRPIVRRYILLGYTSLKDVKKIIWRNLWMNKVRS